MAHAANDLRVILERTGVEEPQIVVQPYDRKATAKAVDFADAEVLGEADEPFADVNSDAATEADQQEASSSTAPPKKKSAGDADTGSGGSRKSAQAQALERLAKIVIGKAKR